ncbi:hypothetical protein V5799_009399, partial [Amblyomma americanum]
TTDLEYYFVLFEASLYVPIVFCKFQVLGANETVHLLQTSYYWNLYATRCMKSRFGKVLGKSVVRSVEYWGLDTSSHAPKFRKFVMILKLTIHNNGRHQPFLHVERLDKRDRMMRFIYWTRRQDGLTAPKSAVTSTATYSLFRQNVVSRTRHEATAVSLKTCQY